MTHATTTPRLALAGAAAVALTAGLASPAGSATAASTAGLTAVAVTPTAAAPQTAGTASGSAAMSATPASHPSAAYLAAMRCTPSSARATRHLQKWPNAVRSRIGAQFRIGAIGGYRPGSGSSDHHSGYALDVMVPLTSAGKSKGAKVAAWSISNARRLNVKYVIWYQRIWMPGRGWKAMASRGSATANHKDHVHISFNRGRGACPAF
jgi:hypothetical protein